MNFKNHFVLLYINSLRFFTVTALLFVLSSCSLSGSIKSVGSQKDEAPASPITSPVTGSDELRLTEPTDYIKPSNESAYPITGSCKTTGTLTIEVNNTVVKSDVSCVNETFTTTLDLASITSGEVTIKVISNENTSTVSTVAIIKDTVAPSLIGAITDGIYFNSTSTTPTLTWVAASDEHSGISRYEVAIGTTSGGTNTLNWTSTNSTTASHSQSGLTLIEGTQYFASLRAVDNAGNVSTTIQSDGWIVDATAPTLASSFSDGGEINFSSTSSKILNWVASTDAGSGLSGYEVALGTTAGATDVMNWTSVGNVITETIDSLTLFGNRRYYASLRSMDVAGNRTASVMSDGWWNLRQSKKAVDVTTPQARWLSASANFGESVALSEDGNTMVVGAKNEDYDENGANYLSDAGAVFVYIKSGGVWVFQQKLVASGTNARVVDDYFGYSVAISGETIVVGAYQHAFDASGANSVTNAGAAYVFVRSAGVWSQQQKLLATGTNAREAGDYFGISVTISGETIVIGASGQDFDASGTNSLSGAGAAYVFVRSAGMWSQQQKLVANGTNSRLAFDVFGMSVSIDLDTIVVGAYVQDFDASGTNSVSNAGAAYVFVRSAGVWSQQQKLVASGTNARIADDYFGYNVGISGETIVVGAHNQDFDASGANSLSGAGAAYVFVRSAGVWSQQQKLVASGTNARAASDYFGRSVSISGETIVIGASLQDFDASGANSLSNAGAAYVFVRSAGVWSQQQKLVTSGTNARVANDYFGGSVSISGETIIVGAYGQAFDASGANSVGGAGAAYTYTRSASTWSQDQKIVDTTLPASRLDLTFSYFGTSVAISEDGLTLVVGASGDDSDENGLNYISNAGAAYVYFKNAGTWVFQQKLVATGANARVSSDTFGKSVSISGETIVVGATSQDYDEAGNNLASSAGAAFVYTRSNGVWVQQQKLVATGTNARIASDIFGCTVAISDETIVVGAYGQDFDASGANSVSGAGAAYVFVRSAGVWSQQQKLVATGTNARNTLDNFGDSVSISGDTIVVGANRQDFDASGENSEASSGAAYVFVQSAGVWSQQQKLVASGTNARISGDEFGYIVSISGDTIVVGAYRQDFDASGENSEASSGAAYVFVRSAGTWTQQQKLVATGTNARSVNDYFGYYVAISGETIVIGANQQDFDASGANSVSNAGAAFVFRRSGTTWSQELKLNPTGTNSRLSNMYFGASVAVSENESADGYTIGIGASGDTFDSSGGGNAVPGAGSIYIFD